MATNSSNERRENSKSKEEEQELEEEEEEALSLCDLPVNLITEEIQSANEEPKSTLQTEEDFDFNSLSTESEMCAADEVFFQGQILPVRLSISSDSGYPGSTRHSMSRSNSQSESMDHHRYSVGFNSSISSRSSSIGSRHSSSTGSTLTTATSSSTKYKPKVRNQFHTHPSPKPQIIISGNRPSHTGCRSRKLSVLDFFRLDLVRTPEIELQDLRLRTSRNSNNSNSSSSSSGCKVICYSNDGDKSNDDVNLKKNRKQRFFAMDNAFLSGCKCSSGAVETVSSKIVIIKRSGGGGLGPSTRSSSYNESETHEIKEKQQEMRKQKHKQQQQGKQAVSRHRTFEWLKELSLEADLDDEA